MGVSSNENNLLLGRGKVYFDRFDASGVATGLRYMGECDKIELTPSVNKKEYYTLSKSAATKLAENVINQTHELDVQLREYTTENMAIALLGDSSVQSQSQATVVDEALTAKAVPGYIYQTAKRNISVVSCKTGTTALVAATDYEVMDAKIGLIRVLPGTTQLDGTKPLTISYTAAAITTGLQVAAGKVSKVEGRMVFVGDPANGPELDVQIWKVRFSPAGALSLITDDYGSIPLKGEVLDDSANHPTAPLYLITQR